MELIDGWLGKKGQDIDRDFKWSGSSLVKFHLFRFPFIACILKKKKRLKRTIFLVKLQLFGIDHITNSAPLATMWSFLSCRIISGCFQEKFKHAISKISFSLGRIKQEKFLPDQIPTRVKSKTENSKDYANTKPNKCEQWKKPNPTDQVGGWVVYDRKLWWLLLALPRIWRHFG